MRTTWGMILRSLGACAVLTSSAHAQNAAPCPREAPVEASACTPTRPEATATFTAPRWLMLRRSGERRPVAAIQAELAREANVAPGSARRPVDDANRFVAHLDDYESLGLEPELSAYGLGAEITAAETSGDTSRAASLRAQREPLLDESRLAWESLVRGAQRVVETAPAHPQMDAVLFRLGGALGALSRHDEALRVYRVLIQRFPMSPYVPHAYLVFAEHYFDTGVWESAKQFYERVVADARPTNRVFAYGTYRLAWTALMLGDPVTAERHFDAVSAYAAAHPDAPASAELARAARVDLATARAEAATSPADVLNTIRDLTRRAPSPAEGTDAIVRMALRLRDDARWPLARAAYQHLATQHASDARRCEWQREVARATVCASRPRGRAPTGRQP